APEFMPASRGRFSAGAPGRRWTCATAGMRLAHDERATDNLQQGRGVELRPFFFGISSKGGPMDRSSNESAGADERSAVASTRSSSSTDGTGHAVDKARDTVKQELRSARDDVQQRAADTVN